MAFHYRGTHQTIATGAFLFAGVVLVGFMPFQMVMAQPRPVNDKPEQGTEVGHQPASAQPPGEQQRQVVTPDKQHVSLVQVEIKDTNGKDVVMSGTELERGDKTSKIKVVVKKRVGSVGSRTACLTMVYKLMESAAKKWRLLNGSTILVEVLKGTVFVDGVMVPQVAA